MSLTLVSSPVALAAMVKPGPLAVAVALVGALVWRWARLSVENRVIGGLAAVGLAVYGSGIVHLPSLEAVILKVGQALGPYTYVLVGVMAFLETGAFIGLVAPGEFTVILGGVFAGQGQISIVPLIGLVWLCAVAGDTTSFLLGRRLGRDFLLRHGSRVKITRERLEQVEGFFDRHGGKTILVGRFIGLVRAMAPFIAGASRMPFRRFIPYDVVSAGLWAATFCLLGFVFWHSFGEVVRLAKRGALALGLVLGAVVGGVALYRYLRVPANRSRARAWIDEQAERPALRPVARVARPLWRRVIKPVVDWVEGPLRFLWDRVTPGELGLELTTLLSVALVGAYVFGALSVAVDVHHQFFADGQAFDVAASLRLPPGVAAARVVTTLGSAWLVGPLVLVAAAYLVARRHSLEGLTLVAGSLLTVLAVNIAKHAEHRPRPPEEVVHAPGFSFPSGHAAYSVAYVAVAVALVHVRFVYRAALVVTAVILAGAIGLTRVYLQVHYLSDVLAGWALAAALFAACGLVAMLVAFVRHNRSASA